VPIAFRGSDARALLKSETVCTPPLAPSRLVLASWGTDVSALAAKLVGSGFGSPSQSSAVQVVAWGTPWSIVVNAIVLSNQELRLIVSGVIPGIVPRWTLAVTVSNQSSTSNLTVVTRPPTLPVLTFLQPPNGTHYFVLVTGEEYGPVVGSVSPGEPQGADHLVRVDIDSQPCDLLTMTRPHTQLLCVTRVQEGLLRVVTPAGNTSALYSEAELLQPPIVRSVRPAVWSTSDSTTIVIVGER
jgi:hypothetical protein